MHAGERRNTAIILFHEKVERDSEKSREQRVSDTHTGCFCSLSGSRRALSSTDLSRGCRVCLLGRQEWGSVSDREARARGCWHPRERGSERSAACSPRAISASHRHAGDPRFSPAPVCVSRSLPRPDPARARSRCTYLLPFPPFLRIASHEPHRGQKSQVHQVRPDFSTTDFKHGGQLPPGPSAGNGRPPWRPMGEVVHRAASSESAASVRFRPRSGGEPALPEP